MFNVKHVLPVLILVLVVSNVSGLKVIYEDNTFLNNLICCNETDCITLRDISYIDNNSLYEFNVKEISNISVCYEAGNKFDSNISDIALSFPKSIVLIIFAGVIVLFTIYLIFRAVRGKR